MRDILDSFRLLYASPSLCTKFPDAVRFQTCNTTCNYYWEPPLCPGTLPGTGRNETVGSTEGWPHPLSQGILLGLSVGVQA